MYPHERSLVKKFDSKIFAIVGVNSDTDREKLKDVMVKEEITWRSFWNGGSTSGPISTAWNVHGWPTTYVIDQEGVIRFKNLREQPLEDAIESLLHKDKPAGNR